MEYEIIPNNLTNRCRSNARSHWAEHIETLREAYLRGGMSPCKLWVHLPFSVTDLEQPVDMDKYSLTEELTLLICH